MPTQITTWCCDVCGKVYDTVEPAQFCESLGTPEQAFKVGDKFWIINWNWEGKKRLVRITEVRIKIPGGVFNAKHIASYHLVDHENGSQGVSRNISNTDLVKMIRDGDAESVDS